jgi:uncharacterized protein YyaL (SSP411 family)
MAHESFEDVEVAEKLNTGFVPVKVDREERPDIDSVYIKAARIANGSGGWPLTVIMTPDGIPFSISTYLPKTTGFGRTGLMDLLDRISYLWNNRRSELLDSARNIMSGMRMKGLKKGMGMRPGMLDHAYDRLASSFDDVKGGFGTAPKFPVPHRLLFLLRYWYETGEAKAIEMVKRTLEEMRSGGIYDHVGGGFHRYSTDAEWKLPHFEKMLYDQAMLATTYTEAYQATGDELFKRTVEEISDYVIRELGSPEGGFYSSEDADSEGVEGKYYMWEVKEITRILPISEAREFIKTFHMREGGNFYDKATGEKNGKNILYLNGRPQAKTEKPLRSLLAYRKNRISPAKDDKILTDWNGLMISALSRAGQALDRGDYVMAARRSADFILSNMIGGDGRLMHRFRDGEAAVNGMLEDYAFFINGLLDLYEATFNSHYLQKAVDTGKIMIDDFHDPKDGGFFHTAHKSEGLISREKEAYDGAIPSGNSGAMMALIRLSRFTGRTELEKLADDVGTAFSTSVDISPSDFAYMLCAYYHAKGPSREIIISGERGDEIIEEMIRALRDVYLPSRVVILRRENDEVVDDICPFAKDAKMIDGKTTAYVCDGWKCDAPVQDTDHFRRILEEIR